MDHTDAYAGDKAAAIAADRLADTEIGQISARDFLNILDKEGLGARSLTLLPEKKKLELWAEPEWHHGIKLGDLVRVLKTEKKKVELEVPPGLGWRGPGWAAMAGAGGAVGYPNPDDDRPAGPPHVEWRKMSLDQRFEQLTQQVAQLGVAMRELNLRLDARR